MKLTSIDLYSNGNQIAALSFKDPRSKNPYIAQQVTGLDADEIVPKFYGTNLDGSINHYDLVLNKREIVILVALNPTWSQGMSYSDLRDDLYRGIAASRDGKIQIRLNNGSKTIAAISGFVTKFETSLFSKTPQAQLTIRCDSSILRSIEEVSFDITQLSSDTTLVDNVSTSPHGFKFNITFEDISESFVIQDKTYPEWQFTITPGIIDSDTGFLANDVLYFSSIYDEKTVYINRADTIIFLVDKILTNSTWPIMFPGINNFKFISDNAFTWNEFTYFQTYWGV